MKRALFVVVLSCLVLGLLVLAPAVFGQVQDTTELNPPLVRFAIVPPTAQPLRITNDRDLVISPDGTHLAYIAGAYGQPRQLMVRSIDQLDAVPLRGVTGPSSPFFSPDGRWIGFFAQGELKKESISGESPISICRTAGNLMGASWGPDETIVFATDSAGTGLFSVPAGGGEPKLLTTPAQGPPDATFPDGERAHLFPSVLPGGRAVLFTIRAKGPFHPAQVAVAVLDLTTGRRKTLIRGGSQAEYVSTGHIVFAASGTLRAVRFDLARLELLGDPIPVVEHVLSKVGGAADFSVSQRGTLVYVPGGAGGVEFRSNSVVWVNRLGGVEEPIEMPPHGYGTPRLSPDGTRVALTIRDAERGFQDLGIAVWDLARKALTPLPFRDIAFPVWTPDGRRILSASELGNGGVANLYRSAGDGTGTLERLTTSPNDQWAQSISPDGRRLVFLEFPRKTPRNWNLGLLSLGDLSTPGGADKVRDEPLMRTPANKMNAEVSPDGRWLAFQSNESGRNEVYVRPFPNVDDGLWQLSRAGGTAPVWARSGRELFYLDAVGLLTTVPVQTIPTFQSGAPTTVLYTRYQSGDLMAGIREYDVSLDGQRFLMIKDTPASIVVVLNWFEELKRQVRASQSNAPGDTATARTAAEHFVRLGQQP